MSKTDSTDILRQEELRIERRFEGFGPEITQTLGRIFARFGHFRPLLDHLKLECDGDLEAQQEVLVRCLNRFGTALFLQGIEEGKNPKTIVPDTIAGADDLPNTRLLNSTRAAETELDEVANTKATAEQSSAAEADESDERRRNSPGRRVSVSIDFPNNRRKVPSRRNQG